MAGFWYGLAVHFKIYPIIYSFVFYFFIDMNYAQLNKQKMFSAIAFCDKTRGFSWSKLFSKNRLTFTFVSAGTFIGLTALFYLIYGYEFLYEAYLYHFIRKDHRHNNSVYWYLIYQTFDEANSTTLAILSFLPQWICVISAGLLLYYDIWICMTVQTWAFVIFNKVMTAQYYLWYQLLVPICAINSRAPSDQPRVIIVLLVLWALG